MKKTMVFFLVFLVIIVSITEGQSFGIKMGLTLQQLKAMGFNPILKTGDTYRYFITVPQPHPLFDPYIVDISPTYGVYVILATSKFIASSSYGTELKSKFDEIKNQIARSYGKSEDYDFLEVGSIWNEDKDWMMSLYKKERNFDSMWDKESGADLPNDIDGIWLSANATPSLQGYLRLQYESIYVDEADAEINAAQSAVFNS